MRPGYPAKSVGLAIVKEVVEHHGGRIWLDLKVSQGTAVWFTLPAAEVAAGVPRHLV
ncbi:ATP-binding protein [Actinoplanes sp. TFC3]|uniref:ATP-binding protein n=1 Tax=Actinoplanes sp. TFC3 TaxID=1710355 RepID=UPI0009E9AC81|nr:ATP-binding protein [Actinoplanes sp. TFC3]